MKVDSLMCVLKRNSRSRSIRLRVVAGGEVFVSAPRFVSEKVIERFVLEKRDWINKNVEKFKLIPKTHKLGKVQERKLFNLNKSRALELSKQKVFELNKNYNFKFGKIAVRNSRTRWGSCSSKGTLSFNYKIVFLPEMLVNYLVVHELCHLAERNHGKAFWELVAESVPDFKVRRKELMNFDSSFIIKDGVI